jgi:hypothetical protein
LSSMETTPPGVAERRSPIADPKVREVVVNMD